MNPNFLLQCHLFIGKLNSTFQASYSMHKKYIRLKVPRNPTNFAFICTQVGLILDIFLFFVCKKHYFEK